MTHREDRDLTLQTKISPSLSIRKAVTHWLSKKGLYRIKIPVKTNLRIRGKSIELQMSRKELNSYRLM